MFLSLLTVLWHQIQKDATPVEQLEFVEGDNSQVFVHETRSLMDPIAVKNLKHFRASEFENEYIILNRTLCFLVILHLSTNIDPNAEWNFVFS